MGKRKNSMQEDTGGDWITTFGDLMSLMLCFFLILYTISMANTSKEDMQIVMKEIRTGFLKTVKKPTDPTQPQITPTEKVKKDVVEKIKQVVIQENLEDYIDVVIEEKKIKIILKQPIVFESGSATLKPQFKDVLRQISGILEPLPNPIFIEGHTDNVPLAKNARYESNWELSFARSYSIIKFFQGTIGIDPERLSGTGYGEYKPLAPNDTLENKAKNRRIEINILFTNMQKLTASTP